MWPFYLPISGIDFRIADNYCVFPGGDLKRGIIPDVDLGDNFYKETFELGDLKNFLKRAGQLAMDK